MYGNCKFGEYCCYSHAVPENDSDDKKEELENIKIKMEELETKVTNLQKEIIHLKRKKETNSACLNDEKLYANSKETKTTDIETFKVEYKCGECHNTFKSKSGLTQHMTAKHKMNLLVLKMKSQQLVINPWTLMIRCVETVFKKIYNSSAAKIK